MATRAVANRRQADWRAAFRRSFRRAAQMTGAAVLFAGMIFLGLALFSYTQTDPSPSTAAASHSTANWMGGAGAWSAERVLFAFGLPGVLLLPLLYVTARKLWRDVEQEDVDTDTHWWMPLGMLLLAMALLATVLSLVFDGPGGHLPASMGGLTGLLGASGIEAVGGRFPAMAGGWVILALALACLGGGVFLVTRVFALDWAQLLTLPAFLKRAKAAHGEDDAARPGP